MTQKLHQIFSLSIVLLLGLTAQLVNPSIRREQNCVNWFSSSFLCIWKQFYGRRRTWLTWISWRGDWSPVLPVSLAPHHKLPSRFRCVDARTSSLRGSFPTVGWFHRRLVEFSRHNCNFKCFCVCDCPSCKYQGNKSITSWPRVNGRLMRSIIGCENRLTFCLWGNSLF